MLWNTLLMKIRLRRKFVRRGPFDERLRSQVRFTLLFQNLFLYHVRS